MGFVGGLWVSGWSFGCGREDRVVTNHYALIMGQGLCDSIILLQLVVVDVNMLVGCNFF